MTFYTIVKEADVTSAEELLVAASDFLWTTITSVDTFEGFSVRPATRSSDTSETMTVRFLAEVSISANRQPIDGLGGSSRNDE